MASDFVGGKRSWEEWAEENVVFIMISSLVTLKRTS